MLRPAGYIPVPVRLSMDGADGRMTSFAGCITDAVERTVNDIRLTAAPVHTDTSDKDYLWEYFATRHFYEGDREVFPVIVIDQFEENFSVDKEGTWRLMEQLHSLMDDNKIYPDNYHNETIFRIVLSIREDDLYRLEDCIDQLNLNDFKFNRYRLTQLSDDEAREIIVIKRQGNSCQGHNKSSQGRERRKHKHPDTVPGMQCTLRQNQGKGQRYHNP